MSICRVHWRVSVTQRFNRPLKLFRTVSIAFVALTLGGEAFSSPKAQAQETCSDGTYAQGIVRTFSSLMTDTGICEVPAKYGISVEGMIIQRDDLEIIQFTGPEDPGDVFTSFSSSELDQTIVGGLRATLAGRLLDIPMEFSGFYVAPMVVGKLKRDFVISGATNGTNATYHVNLNPNADISIGNSDSDDIFAMQVRHQTNLFGAEANARDALGIPGLLFGVRGLYFGERLSSVTYDNEASLGRSPTDNERDRTSTRVDNYLLGLQIGLDGSIELMDGVNLGASVKAGLYNNHVERHRTFNRDIGGQASRTMGDDISHNQLSTAVEVNPRLDIELFPGVSLNAKGWLLWIDDVGEALPHFFAAADRDDQDIRADGDVVFWGGSLGLTVQLDKLKSIGSGGTYTLPDSGGYATAEDIDERVAELEATTARAGNPNMTIELFGVLDHMVTAYGDGEKWDVDVVNNTNSPTRFGIKGYGRITNGWTAGYLLEIQSASARSVDINQIDDGAKSGELETRHSAAWLRNNQLGKMSIGFTSTATDNIILYDLGGVHVAASNDTRLIGGDLFIRHSDEIEQGNGALLTLTPLLDFLPGLDTARRNIVRYDSPRIAGFVASAAWGEDDFWDAALRYRLNWNDWKLRAGVGYLQDTTEPVSTDRTSRDRRELKGSASLIHKPSGLFLTTAFTHREYHGERSSDLTTAIVTPVGTNRPDFDYRYISSGVRQQLTSLGETSVYGEYALGEDGVTGRREGGSRELTDSEITMMGVGIVQKIDDASMELFLAFRHFEFQVEGFDSAGRFDAEDLEDINIIYSGARIKF